MSNTNNNTAAAISNLMWEGSVEIVHQIANLVFQLAEEMRHDPSKMGLAIGNAWHQIGGEVESAKPARLLIESCHEAKMDKKSIYALMKSAEIISKQRVSQIYQSSIEGNKDANKGSKDRKAKDGQGGLDKSGITWEQILEAIKAHPSITQVQAETAAALLASKIA